MARSANPHPTDGELEILRVLWEREAATLGDVCEVLRRERDVATTTVATMLGVMLEKGLVRRKKAARGYQWSAAVSRNAAAKGMVGKLVNTVFDGSASLLVSHLVEGGKLSKDELAELRRLIDSNANNSSRKGAKAPRTQNK
jgi:BlaI family transcriptional regulator, penicillinase repressor